MQGSIVKIDTATGATVRTYTMGNSDDQRGMVSVNEITGGGVNIGSAWAPIVYQLRTNTRKAPSFGTDGCSVCPSPNGIKLTNNIYASSDGFHRSMRILDTNGVQLQLLYLKDIVPTQFTGSEFHADMQTWSGRILIPVGQANGDNVPVTVSPNVAGLIPGTYLDTISINTANAGNKTFPVSFAVRRPAAVVTLGSASVYPKVYTIAAGSSVTYHAICKDIGNNYITTPSLQWSTTGGGTINALTGLYTAAGASTHGPHFVIGKATLGSVTISDTVQLIVSRTKYESLNKKISCGSNTFTPTNWGNDDSYITGGADLDVAGTITTAGVGAAAPANVYKSVRSGASHSYLFPGLKQGDYTIRMHFVDWKDTLRKMNYSILATPILTDLSVSANSASTYRIELFSLRGEKIQSFAGIGNQSYMLTRTRGSQIPFIRMTTATEECIVKTLMAR